MARATVRITGQFADDAAKRKRHHVLMINFLANVNSWRGLSKRSRLLYAIARPSVVCLSRGLGDVYKRQELQCGLLDNLQMTQQKENDTTF